MFLRNRETYKIIQFNSPDEDRSGPTKGIINRLWPTNLHILQLRYIPALNQLHLFNLCKFGQIFYHEHGCPGGRFIIMYWRSLITVSLGFLITWHHNGISSAAEPGYLDFDNLPDTNFSCERKVIGGYYADIETGCQMFHVCTIGQKGEITDIKFLCLNGTVFDQETRVCERLDEVDCSKSESFFDLNLELYGNNAAGFGIQPEGEESEDLFEKCNPDSDDDCNTDSPSTKNESQESHEETIEEEIIEEVEETTTSAPVTSSTTTRRPLPSSTTGLPSTTPSPPKVYNYPTSSQETVAALLALHNAFTASLQQHADPQKPKPNPPRITGFINTNPSSTNSGGFHNQHHSSLTPPRPPTQFTPPSATDHLQNFQSQKQNYQNHNNKPNNFQNPVQTTSEHYGNGNFHHEFHINSQTGHFPVQNFQDNYHQQHQSASAIPQTSHPKPFQFHQFDDNDYYVKTHSSTVTPFILHQLKVNRLKENQDSSTGSVTHGSYVRDVSSAGKSHKNSPFRSQTTPAIAVVTSTSTTSSSSSTKNGKYNPSAISNRQPQTKQFAHSTNPSGFARSIDHRNKNSTQNRQAHLSNYDDYQESDVHSDPFFKDVPKIGRSKRYAQFNAQRTNRRQRPRVSELPLPQSESDEPKINNLTTLQPPTNRRNNRRRPSTYISSESPPLRIPAVQPIMNINQERKQINTPSISNTRPLEDLTNIEVVTQQIPTRRTHRRKHVTVIKSTTEETVTVYSEENIVPPSTPQTPGSKFTCDNKIKGGYYADTEANCLGFFICSQGEVNGPLLKTHFWCGATTKFNQRSRTCQAEDNVVCSISERYYHLNQDFLVPAPEDEIRDSFEPQKVQK